MPSSKYHPRYWFLHFALFIGQFFVWVTPFPVMLRIGRFAGHLIMTFSKRRRKIVVRNLERCFPDSSDEERHELMRKTFESFGMSLVETFVAWWMPNWRFKRIKFDLIGQELIQNHARGLMLCGAHYSPMEMVGRYFGQRFGNLNLVYQRHKDPVVDEMINKGRRRYAKSLVCRKDVREMIRVLRRGEFLWYAPDQDLRAKVSVFVPFFNHLCATVKLTGALLRAGRGDCAFATFYRKPGLRGYSLKFEQSEDYPSGDERTDAVTYNTQLESNIVKHPDRKSVV